MREAVLRIWLCIVILSFLTTAAFGRKLLPADDSRNVPGFETTRSNLFSAVKSRNASFIYSLIRNDSVFSFGSPTSGRAALDKYYQLTNPDDPFWITLEKILPYGGKWDQSRDTVAFPYFYNDSFPEAPDRGVHTFGVIMGKDVVLRNGPGKSYSPLLSLSFEVLRYSEVSDDRRWVRVSDGRGINGWVATRYFHCPFWERLILKRRNGQWIIDSFVSGD